MVVVVVVEFTSGVAAAFGHFSRSAKFGSDLSHKPYEDTVRLHPSGLKVRYPLLPYLCQFDSQHPELPFDGLFEGEMWCFAMDGLGVGRMVEL